MLKEEVVLIILINIKVLPDIQKQNLSVREVLYILVKEKLI